MFTWAEMLVTVIGAIFITTGIILRIWIECDRKKQIPNDEAIKFICPNCGGIRLEAVLFGSHTIIIEALFKNGNMTYGDITANGTLDMFQCIKCGFVPEHEADEPIVLDKEIVEWCKKNCKQEY